MYDDNRTLVLLVTKGHQADVDAIKVEFDSAKPGGGRPTYRIDEASRTLSRLEALKGLMLAKDADLKAKGVMVTLVGSNDKANVLSVGLLHDTAVARDAVLNVLGACANEVQFSQRDVVPAT